jgi:putative drug exporter of the RND superfamily
MMFAVLFGLSMDYQVFLMSQIEHHKAQGESDDDAVANGLATGARVIVAAALIMISVFGSFILNGDPTVKQFGVGLSVGVALAALTVLLFAPAFLVLSGRASWWMPVWANRLLPRVDIEGADFGQPQPGRAPAADAPPVRAGS